MAYRPKPDYAEIAAVTCCRTISHPCFDWPAVTEQSVIHALIGQALQNSPPCIEQLVMCVCVCVCMCVRVFNSL